MNKTLSKVFQIARLLSKDDQPILLSTIGMNGDPRSRYMAAFKIRDTGEFFLISPSNSRKIQEIQKDPRVQVLLFSKDHKQVLTLSGKASIIQDIHLRKEIYQETKTLDIYPVFSDFFGVIHFIPLQAEYLDVNVSNDPIVINLSTTG